MGGDDGGEGREEEDADGFNDGRAGTGGAGFTSDASASAASEARFACSGDACAPATAGNGVASEATEDADEPARARPANSEPRRTNEDDPFVIRIEAWINSSGSFPEATSSQCSAIRYDNIVIGCCCDRICQQDQRAKSAPHYQNWHYACREIPTCGFVGGETARPLAVEVIFELVAGTATRANDNRNSFYINLHRHTKPAQKT